MHGGQHRQALLGARGDGDLGDGVGERGGLNGEHGVRHAGQLRVLLDRQGRVGAYPLRAPLDVSVGIGANWEAAGH
ncbi:hypothetical protein GCM10010441_44990 [Kitasatospora paracochleata]|uniref:Uncharacterized protein n=1 Tax=Kitasatospora paracochleata TaxID=58354 RepID=A0ABT1J9F1_9ACTN|nr:hypothetical protein [Kitasatospora paracochleata]MCP2314077.1 hypothetical protein [Kitasatospora paracochleata]